MSLVPVIVTDERSTAIKPLAQEYENGVSTVQSPLRSAEATARNPRHSSAIVKRIL
jgi:hypothetical protein